MKQESTADNEPPAGHQERQGDHQENQHSVGADPAQLTTHLPESYVPASPGRSTFFLLLTLVVIGCFFTLYYARAVFCPIILAIVLNFLLSPFVRFLEGLKVPNMLGAVVVLGTSLAVVGFAAVQLSTPAAHWLQQAPELLEELEDELRALRRPVQQLDAAGEQLEQATAGTEAPEQTVELRLNTPSLSSTVLSMTGTVIAEICVTLVLLYFLLAAGDHSLKKIVEFVPYLHNKKTIVEIARDVERGISRYLLSVTVINASLGAAIGVAMWLLGVPNPFLWGVGAMLLNYVPYLGAMVGTAIIALVAIATFDDFGQRLLVPTIYFALTALEGNFITPNVLGLRLNLNPVIIFTWMLIWAWLWGIAGALLAVPLLAMIKIACDHIPALHPVARLVGT